jgi:hypothetical protein
MTLSLQLNVYFILWKLRDMLYIRKVICIRRFEINLILLKQKKYAQNQVQNFPHCFTEKCISTRAV